MSILIKGIEIPKNCYECDAIGISDIVGLNCNGIDYEDRFVNRPPDCPVRSISQNWEKILNMRYITIENGVILEEDGRT